MIEEVTEAVRAATEMFRTFTSNVVELGRSSSHAWEYLSAKRMHDRLLQICALSTWAVASESCIDRYLHNAAPTHDDWKEVTRELSHMLHDVDKLLDELKKERSEFVLESAYGKLIRLLRHEADVLGTLTHLPQPQTPEARASLESLNRDYKVFLERCQAALGSIGQYLKSHPAHPEAS